MSLGDPLLPGVLGTLCLALWPASFRGTVERPCPHFTPGSGKEPTWEAHGSWKGGSFAIFCYLIPAVLTLNTATIMEPPSGKSRSLSLGAVQGKGHVRPQCGLPGAQRLQADPETQHSRQSLGPSAPGRS